MTSDSKCLTCGQTGNPKGGEYKCPACGRPTVHDPSAATQEDYDFVADQPPG